MLLQKRSYINWLLVLIAIALTIALYRTWSMEVPALPVVADGGEQKKGPRRTVSGYPPPPAEAEHRVLVERNLFSPDRQEYQPPPEPEAEVVEEPEQEPESVARIDGKILELHGVVRLDGLARALIHNPAVSEGKKSRWLTEGESIGSFAVAAINAESVLLQQGAERFEIQLRDAKKAARAAAPGQRPSPAASVAPTVISAGQSPPPAARPPADSTAAGGQESAPKKPRIIQTPFGEIIQYD